jgi:hypothetical protein
MRKAKTWLTVFVGAVFCSAVLAPVALAMPIAPTVTLKGPSSVTAGHTFTLKGVIGNTAGDSSVVKIVKRVDNKWLTVKQGTVRWAENDMGYFSVKVKATGAAMGLIKFKARYSSGGATGISKMLTIAVN